MHALIENALAKLKLEPRAMGMRASVAVVVVACSGCAPFPHTVTLTPPITGTIARESIPAPKVQVSVHRGWSTPPCQGPSTLALSTSEGQFQFPRQGEMRWFYAPLVVPVAVTPWELCVSEGQNARVAYRSVAGQTREDVVELRCDLAKSQPTMDSATKGVCLAQPQRVSP